MAVTAVAAPEQMPEDAANFTLFQLKADEYAKSPLVRHWDAELQAAFYLKPLSGAEMESAQRLAGDKDEDVPKYMIMIAVRHPSIGLAEYQAFNKLNPGIKARLLKAIRDCSGMGDDAMELGKFDFGRTGGQNFSGTASPENSDTSASGPAKQR